MRQGLVLLVALVSCLPAQAEGGHMYPSELVIAPGLFAFGLGIPAVLAALAAGLARWLRPAARHSWGLVFGAAWLTWIAGMLALAFDFNWGLGDGYAQLLDGLLSFGAALVVAWRPGNPKRGATPGDAPEPLSRY